MEASSLRATQHLLALGRIITVKKGGKHLKRGQEMFFLWGAPKHAQAAEVPVTAGGTGSQSQDGDLFRLEQNCKITESTVNPVLPSHH